MATLMNLAVGGMVLFGLGASSTVAQAPNVAAQPPSANAFPAWAYPWAPDFMDPPDDGIPRRVPDSTATFTVTQRRDLFFVPDWHPDDHLPMPDVVANGRRPDVRACGSCHRAEGTGAPENASLAGLPASYIVQQMVDYKSGTRKFSGPQRSPSVLMTAIAKAATEAEMKAAAAYFSSLKMKKNIKVIETDTVPTTMIARMFYIRSPDEGTEPIGERIVEIPVDVEQFENRDTRTQFLAYVPTGSIAKGEALVRTGASGKTFPCAMCHGPTLRGVDSVPGIAGRSPSYLVRQMYDFQQRNRGAGAGQLMLPVVDKLSHGDMISLAAYISSLDP